MNKRTLGILSLVLPVTGAACSSSTIEDRDNGIGESNRPVFVDRSQSTLDLAEELAYAQIFDNEAAFLKGVDNVATRRVDIDALGMAHTRVRQTVNNVPVFGGEAIIHLDRHGKSQGVTDKLIRDVRVNTQPSLLAEQALERAVAAHGGWKQVTGTPEVDLQVLRHQGVDHLTYRVQIRDFEGEPSMPVIFIDAHTGKEVWRYDNLQTARNRRTHSANNGTSLPGTLVRTEGSANTGDAPVDNAHNNAGLTYDYYSANHGRDSYDGNGATLTSTAHYSTNYDNAFWDGSQMVYGDGATYFYPLSGALDVVAHELTHAVTEYSANLIYSGESGGLNEATSDIMGAVIESWSQGWVVDADTWKVGEDITKPALGEALRFMDNPPADGSSIDNYANYFSGIDVHYSSGIANKAFYLMVQSLDPSAGVAMQKAANIWYRALTVYMTPSTTFSEARGATTRAAEDLFGAGSLEAAEVGNAWAAVGVSGPLPWEAFDTRTGLTATTGNNLNFSFNTPAGATHIKFDIAGGSGDADLYVKFGSAPTTTSYDCRPYTGGNSETCAFSPAQSGTYYVMVRAYSSFSNVTLTASYVGDQPPPPSEVCNDGADNDGDGAVDCADSDCANDAVCAPEPECAGGTFTGTLSSSNASDEYPYAAARSGLYAATLTGAAGTNFDLVLQYRSGNQWRRATRSTNPDSNEAISYNSSTSRLYRWQVVRSTGTGSYTLCIQQ